MKRRLFIIVMLLACYTASALSIRGTIVSGKDKQPIPFANIVMLMPDSTLICGTTANEKGEFELSFSNQVLYDLDGVLAGYLLRISAIGYETLWQKGDLSYIDEYQSTRPPHPVVFALQPRDHETLKRYPVYTIDGEEILYNTADDPSVQTGTANDTLQNGT